MAYNSSKNTLLGICWNYKQSTRKISTEKRTILVILTTQGLFSEREIMWLVHKYVMVQMKGDASVKYSNFAGQLQAAHFTS